MQLRQASDAFTLTEVPDRALAVGLYRDMLRIRRIEEAVAAAYAEQEMRCPVHLSIGQEAAAVGVCAALAPGDQAVSSHRSHAHYLAMNGDLTAMVAEFYGKATGTCGGRGGSMHIFDDRVGMLVSVPIVASSIPLGVGVALAAQQSGSDQVVFVFFGDAAVEEGVFHESANFAELRKLPVVFVCENNLFSVYTHLDDRQPRRPITDLARAHGIAAQHGDGNDVGAVMRMAQAAVRRARAGEGPSFLLLDTYRWLEHCGPNYDNDLGYRTVAEFEAWRERCPVRRFGELLLSNGALDRSAEAAMEAAIAAEIERTFAAVKAAPFPKPETASTFVYA